MALDAPPQPPQPTATTAARNAPGAVVSSTPHRGAVAAERARAGRGATLRMIESGQIDAASAKPSVPPPAAGGAEAEAEPSGRPERAAPPQSARDRDSIDPAPEAEPGGSADGDAEPVAERAPAPAAPDAESAKRLATIQAAERRSRDKIATERRELEARAKAIETEWAPRVKAAEDFSALRERAARARSNPALIADVFRALGYTEDHFEAGAQALYLQSKAGQADPARRQHAERLLREREEIERVDATQARIDALEAKLAQRDQQSEFQRLQGTYLDSATQAVTAETPIAKAAIAAIEKARGEGTPDGRARAAKLEAKLRSRLWEVTVALTDELGGDVPDYGDVIARYEDLRGAELDELGIPRPTATATKPNPQPADKKTPAMTLSADLSTPRVPRPTTSGKDHRAETRRMIVSGKLE